MKWEEGESGNYWYCKTPVGKYEITILDRVYADLGSIRIYSGDYVEEAKGEAKIHLLKTYYSLKIYLEINE